MISTTTSNLLRWENGAAVFYVEIACLSTDTKPTDGIVTGSMCIEVDTGKVYLFNEANGGSWVEQFSLQS